MIKLKAFMPVERISKGSVTSPFITGCKETALNLFTLFYALKRGDSLDAFLNKYSDGMDNTRQQALLAIESIARFLISGNNVKKL